MLTLRIRLVTTIAITLIMAAFMLWKHTHGGVVSHHIFGDENMPSISNWWGLLTIPLATWISLTLIQKRHNATTSEETMTRSEIYRFLGGLTLGITITILFYHAPDYTSPVLLATFVIALFLPIYRPAFYLGFTLSMIYGFGGVIPAVFGLFLTAIFAIEYLLIRKAFLFLINKANARK